MINIGSFPSTHIIVTHTHAQTHTHTHTQLVALATGPTYVKAAKYFVQTVSELFMLYQDQWVIWSGMGESSIVFIFINV
jgi:hypothetical protein